MAVIIVFVGPVHGRAGTVVPLPPVTTADGRLGLCDVLPGTVPGSPSTTWTQLAYNAGARINRWEFRWDHIEGQAGTWDFSGSDSAVTNSLTAGLNVLGILIGTPGWAVSSGQKPGNGVPAGLYLPYNDPHNIWAAYVRHTVSHFAGTVRYWEVWNEPDLPFFWSGSPEDYFRLLKVAYLTIKDVDPSARVLVAGMVAPDMGFFKRVLMDAEQDPAHQSNHDYFDAVSWHAYGQASAVYSNVLRIRSILAADGNMGTPLWITEDGFPASNPNGEPRQAAYVEQTIAYALAAGANKILVYRASDDVLPKTWGLVSAAGAPRLGYVAFQTMASLFAHARAVLYAPTPSLERFVVYRSGRRILMLWSRNLTDENVKLDAAAPVATLTDWQGQSSAVTAADGQFHVVLPGANFNESVDPQSAVVGGPPRFVEQSNATPPSLKTETYISRVTGPHRKLVVLNADDATTAIDVTAAGQPVAHEVVQLRPHTVQSVDLDLVAGPTYTGPFRLASATALQAQGVSDTGVSQQIAPSPSWLVPAAPPAVTIANPSANPASVSMVGYGPRGRARFWKRAVIDPSGSASWSIQGSPGGAPLALSVDANTPVLLETPNGNPLQGVPTPRSMWYMLPTGSGQVSLFNPDPFASSQVEVRFVGSRNFQSTQLVLGPRQSAQVNAHAAAAVIVSATRAIAAGLSLPPASGAGPLSGPALRSTFALGHTVTVRVLNPNSQIAHLTVSTLTGSGSRTSTVTVGPLHVLSFTARNQASLARALVLDSDVPLVSTTE